jgi:hypothetical protein
MRQGAMIAACRLEADPDRQAVAGDNSHQALEVRLRVSQPPSLLARNGDQWLVPVLGDVDGYENARIGSSLNPGHSRSPLWCGSQNHHGDLRPGYGHLLRDLRRSAASHNMPPMINSQRAMAPS